MITASNEIKTKLQQAYSMDVSTRVIAEWNMNRYVNVSSIGNNNYVDDPMYPIRSIVEPRRPGRGILKARSVNEVKDEMQESIEGRVTATYRNEPDEARFYAASLDDPYKYYATSAVATNRQQAFVFAFDVVQRPYVIYDQNLYCNKIVIGIENTESAPVDFTVDITIDGKNWQTIATNPLVDANGRIVLWLSDSLTWTAVQNYDAITQIRGVRMSVSTMTKKNAHLNLIEISPRIENDLTDFTISWNADFSMSNVSFDLPIGRSSSNTGSIKLSNTDMRFNNDNKESLYFDLIDKNVRFKVDYAIKKASGLYEYFRQMTMYAQNWSPSDDQEISVDLKDSSMFAQEEIVPATYFENLTIAAIIWRLFDMMGYTDYEYRPNAEDSLVVPYFWTNGEESLWEVISKLGEVTQTAIFFDEHDVLQIKTKNGAYDENRVPDWIYTSQPIGSYASNIVNVDQSNEFEANSVSVVYKETGYSDFANGFPKMEVSWEPEDTVVLRSSPIKESITAGSQFMSIAQEKAATYPFAGLLNVESEIIRYDAKWYIYYDKNNVAVGKWIKSSDEKSTTDTIDSSEVLAWKNYFSGHLRIVKRGEFGSAIIDHIVQTKAGRPEENRYIGVEDDPFSLTRSQYNTVAAKWDTSSGFLRLARNASPNVNAIHYMATTHKSEDLINSREGSRFGTRFKFTESGWPSSTSGIAGLYFLGGANSTGLYATVHTTAVADRSNRWHNEIVLCIKDRRGIFTFLGTIGHRAGTSMPLGSRYEIVPGKWYDLEAYVRVEGRNSIITLYVNSIDVGTYLVASDAWDPIGYSGPFVRTQCIADFEYVYGFQGILAYPVESNQTSLLDLIEGDYRSSMISRNFKYRSLLNEDQWNYVNKIFFDEFVPIAHEMKEYEIDFEDNPVLHSYLYFSNESQVVCTNYESNPFGAKFIIANSSRTDAIVSGEDKVTFGVDNAVDQKLFVYGRLLEQKDDQRCTVSDPDGIRRRGRSDVVIESQWIQSKDMAKSIAGWVIKNWSNGCDELQASVFYSPLTQLGDLVPVNHSVSNISPDTHKYFVVAVKRSFSNDDITQTITLRRARGL